MRRSEKTYKLLDDSLDERGEAQSLVLLEIPDVLAKDGDGLRVGLGLERVASLLKNELELLVCAGCKYRAWSAFHSRSDAFGTELDVQLVMIPSARKPKSPRISTGQERDRALED